MNRSAPILSLLLAIAVASGPASAQTSRNLRREKVIAPAPGVAQETTPIFRTIEEAWRSGDPETISQFVGEQRVYISLRGFGEEGGYYSKPQVFYLFKRMFQRTKLKRFEFVKFYNSGSKARKVYGTAYRSFESTSSGKLFQDKVYVTLKLEGERWVVSEIKSTW